MKKLALVLMGFVAFTSALHAQPFINMQAAPDRGDLPSYYTDLAYRNSMIFKQSGWWEDMTNPLYDEREEDEPAPQEKSKRPWWRIFKTVNHINFGVHSAALKAPFLCAVDAFDNHKKNVAPAAQGARILMATMYQTCDAPNITIPNSLVAKNSPVTGGGTGRSRQLTSKSRVKAYQKFNPYLKPLDSVGPGCFPINSQPPIYGYGAKATLSKDGKINLHRNQAARGICGTRNGKSGIGCNSKPLSGIDCSGLVLASLHRMGLNMMPFDEHHPGETGTAGLAGIAGKKNSCFEYVEASPEESIKVGDIINIGSNHVVMVDEVGPDPLAIKRHMKNNSCRQISVKDFDFRFIHSGALGHLGVARVDATHPEIEGFMQRLAVKAQAACNALKNKSSMALATSTGKALSVFRHSGDKKAGCVGEPSKFENEDCIAGCNI